MYAFIIVLTVLVSILLIAVVLVQKSKGGGLASNFAGSNQIMGVRRTNDFIEKATWTLAAIIGFLAVSSAFVMPRDLIQSGSRVKSAPRQVEATDFNSPAASEAPALPVSAPAAADAEQAPAPAATPAAAPVAE